MNWKIFFLKFFRNIVLGVAFCTLILGLLGYLLAGLEGAVNAAYWGVALGLIGGFFSGIVIYAKFWEKPGIYHMYPDYNWFVKTDEHKKDQ